MAEPLIPSTMRGLLLKEFNKPYVYSTSIPTPNLDAHPGMLLVRVKVAGFCHTEMMAIKGEYPSPLPMVPGHENVGVVAAVGKDVTGFKIGDRVGTLLFRGACGKCRECLRGTSNYCNRVKLSGLSADGGMAEYMLVDPHWTVLLPEEEELSFVQAAPLMCAGATVYNSLLRCGVPASSDDEEEGRKRTRLIGVVGVGGLGHLGVQFVKAMGYNVVAIDNRTAPLDLCSTELPSHLRPDLLLNPSTQSIEDMLARIKDSFTETLSTPSPSGQQTTTTTIPSTGLDAVLICSDSLPAFQTGLSLLAKHGTLIFVGLPSEPVPFHYSAFLNGDVTVVAGCLPEGGEVTRQMLEVVKRVGVRVVVEEYALEDGARVVEDYGREGMRGRMVLRID